jgi:NADPH2:quinone reductase
MRCVIIDNPGLDSRLLIEEQEKPTCGKEQILVRVKAAALNRADILQRRGKYPAPPGESTILGMEIAGEVVELGSAVNNFKLGDRVYALVAGGGYAEYCCVHQNLATVMPTQWDFTYAAALPEALMTSHASIFLIGQLKSEQTLLIHAAGSGISSLAIQMAKHLGAKVISTTSKQEKMDKAEKLGVFELINYNKDDFETVIKERSVDLVVDFIGGDYFAKHLRLLKPQGKLVQLACMQGNLVECDLALCMRKRLEIHGFILRYQSISEKAALWKSMQHQWTTALLNKQVVPVIDSEFKLEDIESAHTRMQSSAHFGKIIIRMD